MNILTLLNGFTPKVPVSPEELSSKSRSGSDKCLFEFIPNNRYFLKQHEILNELDQGDCLTLDQRVLNSLDHHRPVQEPRAHFI